MNRPTAYNYALNLLGARPYSTSALRGKLIQKEYEPADADNAIGRLVANGLLDDRKYAEQFARSKIVTAGASKRRVQQDLYRKGIKDLGNFASLSVEEQIKKLTAIEKTRFFQLLRTHTIEGMFSDPMHGGNAGLIGWQLVGYPGPQMSYRNDIDKHFGQPWRPKPASLEQVTGRPGKPWEDEKG